MAELGQMLLQAGVITQKQLDEAIQTQVIFGGRLGTNLLELQFIDEETLTKFLVKKHNVPTVDWQSISRIKPGLLNLFPKRLAKKYEAFPLKHDGNNLYVVMTDPANLAAISDMSFATGKTIKPLVLPEVRVFDLLNRFYNIGRELRYISLAMMYDMEREKKERAAAVETRIVHKEIPRDKQDARAKIDFDRSGDLLSEEEFFEMTHKTFTSPEEAPAQPPEGVIKEAPPGPPAPLPALEPVKPMEPAEPPAAPRPAPIAPPVKPVPSPVVTEAIPPAPLERPQPRHGPQPYHEMAQALWAVLIKNQVDKYIPRHTLQEFIKVYLKSELNNFVLSTSHIAHWMLIEGDVPVENIEDSLRQLQAMERQLDVMVLLPGETAPYIEPEPAVAEAPAEIAVEGLPEPFEGEITGPIVEEIPPAEPKPRALEQPAPPALPEEPTAAPVPPPAEEPRARKSAEDILAELEAMEEEEQMVTLTAADQAQEGEEEYIPEEEPEEEQVEIEQLTLAQAQKKLMEGVQDRNDISHIVLGFARGFFKRSALFTVRDDKVYGWDGLGGILNTRLLSSIMIPLSEPSVFKTVIDTSCHYLGPIQANNINDTFLQSLGSEKPLSAFMIPIVVNQKVVYLLYGDNGQGQPVPFDIGELLILALKIPPAIDKLLKRKRTRQGL